VVLGLLRTKQLWTCWPKWALVIVSIQFLWQTPESINLKAGKVYFGSQFQRLQSVVSWLCCFWANSDAEHHGRTGGEQSHSPQGRQETEGIRQRGPSKQLPQWPTSPSQVLPSIVPPPTKSVQILNPQWMKPLIRSHPPRHCQIPGSRQLSIPSSWQSRLTALDEARQKYTGLATAVCLVRAK
jgi:hypothetical protein